MTIIQSIVYVAKLTSLVLVAIFGFLYLDVKGSKILSEEITIPLEGAKSTKVGQYLVFNGKSHPLPERIYLEGYELFYGMKKGDVIKVIVDTNDFVASLHVYGRQMYTLEDYAAQKVRRQGRFLRISTWFFVAFVFFYFVGRRQKSK